MEPDAKNPNELSAGRLTETVDKLVKQLADHTEACWAADRGHLSYRLDKLDSFIRAIFDSVLYEVVQRVMKNDSLKNEFENRNYWLCLPMRRVTEGRDR